MYCTTANRFFTFHRARRIANSAVRVEATRTVCRRYLDTVQSRPGRTEERGKERRTDRQPDTHPFFDFQVRYFQS